MFKKTRLKDVYFLTEKQFIRYWKQETFWRQKNNHVYVEKRGSKNYMNKGLSDFSTLLTPPTTKNSIKYIYLITKGWRRKEQ